MRTKFRQTWPLKVIASKHFVPTFLGLLITCGFYLANLYKPQAIEQLGNLLFDKFQQAAPRTYDPLKNPVRIIDIDNESLNKLGQWPWPRTTIAKLNDRLSQAGAGVIAYDIVFSEADRTSPENMIDVFKTNPNSKGGGFENLSALTQHDEILANSFFKSNVVAGFFFTRDVNESIPKAGGFSWSGTSPKNSIVDFGGAISSIPILEKKVTSHAFISLNPGADGIIRKAPLIARIEDNYYRSLSLEALRVVQGAQTVIVRSSSGSGELADSDTKNPKVSRIQVGAFELPTTPTGELQVHFSKPVPERYIPAWKILSNDIPMSDWADRIAGHIVFIGTGADGLKDLKNTPMRKAEPGVLVHAQAVEQIINGQFLKRPYWVQVVELSSILIFGIFLAFCLPRLGARAGFLLGTLTTVLVYFASWIAFKDYQFLLNPVYPLLAILFIYIVVTVSSFYLTESERSRIRNSFGMYLSPTMVKRVTEDPSQLTLGGEERNMTILFLDIRGFSKISESMQPTEITTFLNIFLTPMTDILQENFATIDKYIGDAIVAFWNAPLDDNQHEQNAVQSVTQMLKSLSELNEKYSNQDEIKWPENVSVGIGLNTGICCVGNLGSKQRFSYSMIGDAANLAARIEGLTKQYKVSVLIGNETAKALPDFAILEADLIQVVGRETPERIFILAGETYEASLPSYSTLRDKHKLFLNAYRAQDWNNANALIPALKTLSTPFEFSGYYDVMAERIKTYRVSPPPSDWGGIYVATSK